jgi:hypothetical protein
MLQSSLNWILDNWFNLISGLFGVFGTVLALLQWRETRRLSVYRYLFDVAERHVDNSITEETLAQKQKEVEAASQRIDELQQRIRRDIPVEARRVVLLDRLNQEQELIGQHLAAIARLRKQLAELGDATPMPPEIAAAIRSEIQPQFWLRERKDNLKNGLAALSTAAAIGGTTLPSPFDQWIPIGLLLACVPLILLLAHYTILQDPVRVRRIRGFALGVILSLLALAFGAMGAFLFLIWVVDRDIAPIGVPIAGAAGLALSAAIVAVIVRLHRRGTVTALPWRKSDSIRTPGSTN